jgi:protein TonB
MRVEPKSNRLSLPEAQTKDLIIHKEAIKYPGDARAARVTGTVVVQATISKKGEISDIRPLCGPKILQEAVVKAVRKWTYRPYLLNGEPTELETTITSVFALGK